MSTSNGGRPPRRYRAARAGLVLVASFVNLLGAFVALLSLGGLGAWSVWQFVGAFGFIEAAMGLALVIGPNIWRLPVAELQTSEATRVRLVPSLLLIPQPAAAAKVLAGLLMMGAAMWKEGVSILSLATIPALLLLAGAVLALSLVVARAGVARPDLDVVSLVVRRGNGPDRELGPFSISGVAVQFVTQIGVFPLVKLAPSSIFFRPELVPSPEVLASVALPAVMLSLLAYLLWRGRIGVRAPAEQEQEMDRELRR